MTKLYLRWCESSHKIKRLRLNLVCIPVLLTVIGKQQKIATFISSVTVWYQGNDTVDILDNKPPTLPYYLKEFPRRQIHLVACRNGFTPSVDAGKSALRNGIQITHFSFLSVSLHIIILSPWNNLIPWFYLYKFLTMY